MLRMIHHICIDTDCYKESIDFYVAVMGLQLFTKTWIRNTEHIIHGSKKMIF